MRQERGFIINILAVLAVLGIVFFSQIKGDTNLRITSESANSKNVLTQAQDWLKTHVYPKASVEIEKRGGELQQAVTQQKDIAAKTVWEKIKIYFAEKFSKFSGTKVE